MRALCLLDFSTAANSYKYTLNEQRDNCVKRRDVNIEDVRVQRAAIWDLMRSAGTKEATSRYEVNGTCMSVWKMQKKDSAMA